MSDFRIMYHTECWQLPDEKGRDANARTLHETGPPRPATPLTTFRHYRYASTSLHERPFTAAAVLARRGLTRSLTSLLRRSLGRTGFYHYLVSVS
jgi:hypothetical protein